MAQGVHRAVGGGEAAAQGLQLLVQRAALVSFAFDDVPLQVHGDGHLAGGQHQLPVPNGEHIALVHVGLEGVRLLARFVHLDPAAAAQIQPSRVIGGHAAVGQGHSAGGHGDDGGHEDQRRGDGQRPHQLTVFRFQ